MGFGAAKAASQFMEAPSGAESDLSDFHALSRGFKSPAVPICKSVSVANRCAVIIKEMGIIYIRDGHLSIKRWASFT